ncbi:MAG TPA: A/G-specific adenine glycosylase [Chitinophagaceae bacterium]|nr:A/G-specific adenine glycosylase [Chitinophagaceae bacterium]
MKQWSKKEFTRRLVRWNQEQNDRAMPWKGERDPYRIWLSEIILQQTRVQQGWAYYQAFLRAFPDVRSLASAPDQAVFKLWEGLGYYTRCRNLIASARHIAFERDGRFPDTYAAIRALPGVGPYTAAAIASFAFNLPHAVVDGNVQRVLARVFGIREPADTASGKRLFNQWAQDLLDPVRPGAYNQAIMDFGATVCKPLAPACPTCPLRLHCVARRLDQVRELPVKRKVSAPRRRWIYYLVLEHGDRVWIRQRGAGDIWQGLFEFLPVETDREVSAEEVLSLARVRGLLPKGAAETPVWSPRITQQLSHQQITGRFLRVRFSRKPAKPGPGQWVSRDQLIHFPFPVFIRSYLKSPGIATPA